MDWPDSSLKVVSSGIGWSMFWSKPISRRGAGTADEETPGLRWMPGAAGDAGCACGAFTTKDTKDTKEIILKRNKNLCVLCVLCGERFLAVISMAIPSAP